MILPLAAISVTIVMGGAPIQSYNRPYLRQGHVMAPIAPFVTRCSERISYEGKMMVVHYGSRAARLLTGVVEPRTLQAYYVAVAPLFVTLGADVHFDKGARTLFVRCASPAPIRTPGPYERRPQVAPTMIFTPEPIVTPRPVVTGSPHPRRTPIVITPPRA